MTDLRKAAEIALAHLVSISDWDCTYPIGKAKEALSQALAQEEKPPVKSYCRGEPNYCTPKVTPNVDAVNMSQERVDETAKREHEPVAWLTEKRYAELHTAKREWVGLTEVDIHELMNFDNYEDQFDFAYAIEAKLKEKNGG